jgi:hypothetical protein
MAEMTYTHTVYFLDGPKAGSVRRSLTAPGKHDPMYPRTERVMQFMQPRAEYHLMQLPVLWPNILQADTERVYVAMVKYA